MNVTIKKLFHGFASIRDYLVIKAVKNRENIIVYYNTQHMTIPFNKLDQGFENKNIFISKHDGKEYKLIDYDWIPDLTEQQRLL